MSVWSRIGSFFSGLTSPTKGEGVQSNRPSTYSQAAAAPVTFDTAMTVSAFWASARLLSETVAALPLRCYSVDKNGVRKPNKDYDLYKLLKNSPNKYQTRVEFFETVMLNLVTSGNAYIAVDRLPRTGRIIQLLPLMSDQVEVVLLDDGTVTYQHRTASNVRVYDAARIWHIKLFGNGVIGMSPLAYARQSLGISIATGNRASTLSASGGKTNGVLTVDKLLTKEQRQRVRENFAEMTEGTQDQLFVLEADMKFQRTSLSPQDQQLLETRKFQVEDVARFMGVPSVLINDTSGTTAWGSGIQQIMEGFYKLNLRPYLERIEASIARRLIPAGDWDRIQIEFDFDALLRADQKSRYDGYRVGIQAGMLKPDEARSAEGLEPAGGDKLLVNGTMVPIDQAGARNNGQVTT